MPTQPSTAVPGATTAAEAIARNVKRLREAQRLRQADLSERLEVLGQPMRQNTLTRVENLQRSVTVPELLALALALGTTPTALLDPGAEYLAIGATDDPTLLSPKDARAWLGGARTIITWTTAEAALENPSPLPFGNEAMTYDIEEKR